ncbi:DUF1476 domain-containing protein [Sphingomonas sp. PB2P19]|uniref:DUF1476 domain-containing protein n=1 Tax=Sphingomonas rhamnosi TaxID=3096156 RepID=UPI002FC8E557
MTMFDDRERANESHFAREEELAFRITARRNRLLGQWAATEMALTPEESEAYATALVHADMEGGGDDDVVRKLVGDFTAAGLDHDEATVRRALTVQMIEARRQLLESQ